MKPQEREGGHDGMARAELRFLNDEFNPRVCDLPHDLMPLTTDDHHELPRLQCQQVVGHVPDHRPSEQGMKKLGRPGFETGPLSGGQDQDEEIAAHEARVTALNLLSSRRGRKSASFWARMA